jgi:hypothetical protein
MYQRIPYSVLVQVNKKKPQNYALLKLPPSPHDPSYAEWERNNSSLTTPFDEAKLTQTNFRDISFAKWETRPFPKGIDFESALERIENSNTSEPRVIKYKLNFADGCHILLTRSNWADPSSLYCTECYNPNGCFDKRTELKKTEFQQSTEGLKRRNFLVNETGHMKTRPRNEEGNPKNHTYDFAPPTTGKHGFDFSPVSYITHEVKPNVNFVGVRPGLKESNKTAYHYLRRTDTNEAMTTTSPTGKEKSSPKKATSVDANA